jgi:hypothetical protein
MGANIIKCPQPWVTNISTTDVHSGDFLALSKVRGRWGGFETLEKCPIERKLFQLKTIN